MWKWFNTLIATNTFSENAAHILAAYGATLTVHRFGWHLLPWSLTFVILAAVKEYWYDASFETPPQTFTMNTTDFLGYVVGIVIGLLVIR